MPFTLPDGFTPMQLTTDDLTFDEIDQFPVITGKELGSDIPRGVMLRALSIIGLARHGIEATVDDLGGIPIARVLDMQYMAGQATGADPTVAGA